MNLTQEQINEYAQAKELRLEMDFDIHDNRRLRKYSLWMGKPQDGEEWEDNLFYNNDLRSMCGLDHEGDLILWPRYYAKAWETTYFAKLLRDAISIEVNTI